MTGGEGGRDASRALQRMESAGGNERANTRSWLRGPGGRAERVK